MVYFKNLVILIFLVGLGFALYPLLINESWVYDETYHKAETFGKLFYKMAQVYKDRDYGGYGGYFPIGNDSSVLNSGKICCLLYELDEFNNPISLIGEKIAHADYRSSDLANSLTGKFIQRVNNKDGTIVEQKILFSREAWDWWYALMENYSDGTIEVPYDKDYSKNHYAIVIFPAIGGENLPTFIMNENGAIYRKTFDNPSYINTYPGPDPVMYGWELVK